MALTLSRDALACGLELIPPFQGGHVRRIDPSSTSTVLRTEYEYEYENN